MNVKFLHTVNTECLEWFLVSFFALQVLIMFLQIQLITISISLFCRAEIARLTKVVELKTKEMNRVKRLAKNILDEVCRYISRYTFSEYLHVWRAGGGN